MAAEPFSMLRPIRRRRRYSLPSRGITLSLAAGIPGFGAAASLAISDALAGAAAVPKIEGAASLAVSDALAGAAAVPEIEGAASLAVSDALAGAAAVPEIEGAASLAVSDALVVDGEVTEIAAAVSIAMPLAVVSGRSITYGPSIRAVAFANSAVAAYFSPRIIGDSEPFTLDIAGVLLPGETLAAPPTVACITGDLTLGAVTITGTEITFPISGAGTIGQLSEISVTVTTSARTLNLAARVLTNPFIVPLPNPSLEMLAVPSPVFGAARTGNIDEYEIDLTAWLDPDEIITAQKVICITGDLTIAYAVAVDTVIQWLAGGIGTPGAVSAFLISVSTTQRGPVGFYCGVRTLRGA